MADIKVRSDVSLAKDYMQVNKLIVVYRHKISHAVAEKAICKVTFNYVKRFETKEKQLDFLNSHENRKNIMPYYFYVQ